MNRNERELLVGYLNTLLHHQDDTTHYNERNVTEAVQQSRLLRNECKKRIIDFVESLTTEVSVPPDRRAGLRRCEFKRLERGRTCEDSEAGFPHLFYADSEGTPWAIVEAEDGQVCDAIATTIRFTDIPQAKEVDQ